MARLLATLTLAGALAAPATGSADAIYSYVDGSGVIHYTNVPHHQRYQLVEGTRSREELSRAGPVAPRWTAEFDAHIRAAAQKYGLAPLLVKAVMAVESNFDPAAVSVKGATGLMQLMPQTAHELSVLDILDPAQNIEGGARYLRQLHDEFRGNLELVLAAYNSGPERVRRSGFAVPAIPETQAYVRKVMGLYDAYRKKRDPPVSSASSGSVRAPTPG